MRKQIITIGLSLTMSFTMINPAVFAKDSVASKPNKKFTAFLEQEFKETLEDDYTTLHSTIAHPENYDIDVDKMDIDLGDITVTNKDRKKLQKTEKKLDSFDYSTLDKKQQEIYDAYRYNDKLAKETYQKKYTYYSNLWSTNNGLQNALGSYFSDYQLYSENDIKPLLALIKDTKRYTKDGITYSKRQAQKGLLYMNYKDVMNDLQENIDSKNDSVIKTNLDTQIDNLNLDTDKAQQYKEQIHNALDQYYFPSYTCMKKELKKLKGNIKKPVGMAKRGKYGKELYTLTAQSNSGTTKSVKSIRNDFVDFNQKAVETLQDSEGEDEITTNFTTPEEILSFLASKYTNNFPEINMPTYNIDTIPKEQTSPNIVAYFVQPPIDDTTENIIRYNNTDWGNDTKSEQFYMTFAHEGIPGHMYAFAYIAQNHTYDIENLFSSNSYAEGFATYVEEQALYYLDDAKKSDIEYAIAYEHFDHSLISIFDIDINYNGLTQSQFVNQYKDFMSESALKDLYKTLADNPGVFISYYYGEYEIYQLREKAEKALGDSFNEKQFHQALLEMQNVNYDIVERNIDEYISHSKNNV